MRINTCSQLNTALLTYILVMASPTGVKPVGSPTNPNITPDYNKIPSLEGNKKLTWNGVPMYDFNIHFTDPLNMGLGAISENGATLLRTARGTDPGGMAIGANPHYAVASQQIRDQSANRNYRLFACIMNYISVTSHIYRYLQRTFPNDGRAALVFITNFGSLQYTPDQIRDFENTWDDISIRSLRLRIEYFTLFLLAEAIIDLARKLRKTCAQMKKKFLDALPEKECQHLKSAEIKNRNHNGYAYPALYGPDHVNLVGTPHPLAGQCDLYALAIIRNF